MKKQECGLGPAGEPKEEIVPRGEEEQDGQEDETEGSGAVEHVGGYFETRVGEPAVWLVRGEANGREDQVEKEEEGDEEGLAYCRGVSEEIGEGADRVG